MNTEKYYRLLDTCEDARARLRAAMDRANETRDALNELASRAMPDPRKTPHRIDLWRVSSEELRAIASRTDSDNGLTPDQIQVEPTTLHNLANLRDDLDRHQARHEALRDELSPWVSLYAKLQQVTPPGRRANRPTAGIANAAEPRAAAAVPAAASGSWAPAAAAAPSAQVPAMPAHFPRRF